MNDQAETLRKLMQRRQPSSAQAGRAPAREERCAPVITVASGKGGVGKSCLTTHLGTLLARSGLRVLLVDGDFGLANLDILLGVQPGATLEQVLDGEARLQDAIVGVEPNLWLVPAASGLMELRNSTLEARGQLVRLFEECPWEMDVILLDVGAGIQPNVLSLHNPVFKSVVVLTPEPTALTDAYGLIKLARRDSGVTEFSVIVNQVTDGREARQVYQRLRDVADRFMNTGARGAPDVRIEYLGHWERDEKITQAVMNRKILLDLNTEAASIPSLELLAKSVSTRFLGDFQRNQKTSPERSGEREPVIATSLTGNTTRFWRTLLGSAPERLPTSL